MKPAPPQEWDYYFDEECQAGTCQHARYYAMGDEKPVSCPVRKRRKILNQPGLSSEVPVTRKPQEEINS